MTQISNLIFHVNLFIIPRLFTGEWTFNICHVREIGRRRQFVLSENSSRVTGNQVGNNLLIWHVTSVLDILIYEVLYFGI